MIILGFLLVLLEVLLLTVAAIIALIILFVMAFYVMMGCFYVLVAFEIAEDMIRERLGCR